MNVTTAKTPAQPPQMKRRAANAHFKAVDADQGIGEFIVNTFGVVDFANERTVFGCCTNSILRKLPKGVWSHAWDRPIAKTLEARELPPGDPLLPDECKAFGAMYVLAQFNLEVQDGREAFSHLKFGSIDEFSIGFYVVKETMGRDGIINIEEIDWVEWSPVLVGCNPITGVIDIKTREADMPTATDAGDQTAQTKNESTQTPQTKGVYFDNNDLRSACMSTIADLTDTLYYDVIWCQLYEIANPGTDIDGDGDANAGMDHQLGQIKAALVEYSEIVMTTITAIMSGCDEADETLAEAVIMVRKLFRDPKECSRADHTFAQQLDAVLAAAKNCTTRGAQLKALRESEKRKLSPNRAEQLKAIRLALKEIETVLEIDTTPETVSTETASTETSTETATDESALAAQETLAAQVRAQQLAREMKMRALKFAQIVPTA